MSSQEDAEREALLRRAPAAVRGKMWRQRARGALGILSIVLAVTVPGMLYHAYDVHSHPGLYSAEQQRRQEDKKEKDYLNSLDSQRVIDNLNSIMSRTPTPKTTTPSVPR